MGTIPLLHVAACCSGSCAVSGALKAVVAVLEAPAERRWWGAAEHEVHRAAGCLRETRPFKAEI